MQDCEEMQLAVHAPTQVIPRDEEEVKDEPEKAELVELILYSPINEYVPKGSLAGLKATYLIGELTGKII